MGIHVLNIYLVLDRNVVTGSIPSSVSGMPFYSAYIKYIFISYIIHNSATFFTHRSIHKLQTCILQDNTEEGWLHIVLSALHRIVSINQLVTSPGNSRFEDDRENECKLILSSMGGSICVFAPHTF